MTFDCRRLCGHSDAIMNAMATQMTSLTLVYSTIYSGADQTWDLEPIVAPIPSIENTCHDNSQTTQSPVSGF